MTKIRKSSMAFAAVAGAGGLFLSDHFSTVPGTFLSPGGGQDRVAR